MHCWSSPRPPPLTWALRHALLTCSIDLSTLLTEDALIISLNLLSIFSLVLARTGYSSFSSARYPLGASLFNLMIWGVLIFFFRASCASAGVFRFTYSVTTKEGMLTTRVVEIGAVLWLPFFFSRSRLATWSAKMAFLAIDILQMLSLHQ